MIFRTEVLTLMTAVVVLASTTVAAVVSWTTRRRVEQVHVLVNSRMEGMELRASERDLRVADLIAALERSDTAVPPARPREEKTVHAQPSVPPDREERSR